LRKRELEARWDTSDRDRLASKNITSLHCISDY